MNLFYKLGSYYLFISKVFSAPDKHRIFVKQVLREIQKYGINSMSIISLISVFFGAVIALQTAYGLNNPLLPRYLIGLGTRDSMLLEFSSTIICLILAGKVGSNIASEIGSMRTSEQIDALEIMGVNSANFLVLPKIVALMLFIPILNILSIFLGIFGGWLFGWISSVITTSEFIYGIQYQFHPYYVVYTMIKAEVFAFILTSVSAFYGYNTAGGAIEVGMSSTKAVVHSSVLILMFNVLLTKLLLI